MTEEIMTEEEAIEILDDYDESYTYSKTYIHKLNRALGMAIEALRREPCKDAISRQYLLDNCVVDKVTMPYVPVSKIENAPPVTPQSKTDILDKIIEEIAVLDNADYGYAGYYKAISDVLKIINKHKAESEMMKND